MTIKLPKPHTSYMRRRDTNNNAPLNIDQINEYSIFQTSKGNSIGNELYLNRDLSATNKVSVYKHLAGNGNFTPNAQNEFG